MNASLCLLCLMAWWQSIWDYSITSSWPHILGVLHAFCVVRIRGVYPHTAPPAGTSKLQSDKTRVGQAKCMPEIIVCSFGARARRLVNIYRLLFLTERPNTFAQQVNIADTLSWNCLLRLRLLPFQMSSFCIEGFILSKGVLKRSDVIYSLEIQSVFKKAFFSLDRHINRVHLQNVLALVRSWYSVFEYTFCIIT